jgi:hypothetical protein
MRTLTKDSSTSEPENTNANRVSTFTKNSNTFLIPKRPQTFHESIPRFYHH